MHIIDNVILVHHQASKTTLVFDVRLETSSSASPDDLMRRVSLECESDFHYPINASRPLSITIPTTANYDDGEAELCQLPQASSMLVYLCKCMQIRSTG